MESNSRDLAELADLIFNDDRADELADMPTSETDAAIREFRQLTRGLSMGEIWSIIHRVNPNYY